MVNRFAYLADSEIIEEIYAVQYQINDQRYVKNAGLADQLGLSGLAGSIKGFASQFLGSEVAERGPIGGILSLISFPVLLRMNPLLGTVNNIASIFGWDLASIAEKIIHSIQPKLEAGNLSMGDLDQIGSYFVKENAAIHLLIKEAYGRSGYGRSGYGRSGYGRSGYGRSSKEDILTRIFGSLGKEKGWQFAKAFIFWTIKTALLGAGIVAGAHFLGGLLGIKKNQPGQPQGQPGQTQQPGQPEPLGQTSAPLKLNQSGRGEKYFENDADNIWVVPVVEDVENTLWLWITDIYPELENKEQEITSRPGYKQMEDKMKSNYKSSSPESLKMPPNLHSRKQVVDLALR